jgi:uncharacterized protein YndB with AHSA1/START domain
MPAPDFLYVTYIAATPEQVWAAMTSPEFTQRFFRFRHDGEWTSGARFHSVGEDGRPDAEGVIVACEAPHVFSIRWDRALVRGTYVDLPPAVSTCVLDVVGGVVRLTITETHAPPADPEYVEGGREGWPKIASALKTLVETGRAFPAFRMS